MTWRTSEVELLCDRWADGFSASLIAKELNTSRNAVLGKVNRLGLPKRDTKKSARRCAIRSAETPTIQRRKQATAAMMRTFVETASRVHDVSVPEIMSNDRTARVVSARWYAIKLGRAVGINKLQIAKYLQQDNATIMHACKKMGVA